jgi:cell division protein FtsW (lipid II flippase)
MSAEIRRAEEDLDFLRRVVRRDSGGRVPAAIALLWAAISLVGFGLVDFAPRWVSGFWMVAGPAGFLLSLLIGMRASRAAGEEDRAEGRRWAAHWLGLLAAIALSVLARTTGAVTWEGFGATIVLLVAVAYFTAGVHLARPLLGVAAVLAAGYVAVLLVPGYTWTWLGVLTAAALVATAFLGRRPHGA